MTNGTHMFIFHLIRDHRIHYVGLYEHFKPRHPCIKVVSKVYHTVASCY